MSGKITNQKILTLGSINENMKKCKYDVRGEIYLAAVKRTQEGKLVVLWIVSQVLALYYVLYSIKCLWMFKTNYVFPITGKEVIYTNVGNPQALGQIPLTFNRQVMCLLMAPFLIDNPKVTSLFPPDVVARAKLYLSHIKGGLGAYSDSRGN